MAGRHYAKKNINIQRSKKEPSTKKKVSWLFSLVILVLAGVVVFSGYKVITILLNYQEGTSAYNSIAEKVVVSGTVKKPTVSGNSDPDLEQDTVVEEKGGITVDFEALVQMNEDVIGWLYSEDTVINYPIVKGSDNSYYLDHRFDGAYSSFGTLFADYRDSSDFSAKQTTIYGHNMDNGSMFASLLKYRKQSYYDEHPRMFLYTPEKTYVLEIFSGYIAATDDWCYKRAYTDAEYKDYLDYLVSKSCFVSDTTVSENDRIVLLSTCAYDFDDARFVVIGKLVEVAVE